MNVLCHPEIASSKPKDNDCQPTNNQISISSAVPPSAILPSDLNLSDGLAGTLIDRIVLESNREATASGTTIAERIAKRQATAQRNLENHEKRCTAGLIASAGKFKLNEDILSYARHTKELQEAKQREKQLKAKDAYDSLCIKVEAIRNKNLPPEKWTSAELNTMIQWFKRPDDTAMPPKKKDKLARYRDICGRGDPLPPQLPTPMAAVPSLLSLPPAVTDLPELVAADDLHEVAAALEPAAVDALVQPVAVDGLLELMAVEIVPDSAADDDSADDLLRAVFGVGV
jgi:hypothetical protein